MLMMFCVDVIHDIRNDYNEEVMTVGINDNYCQSVILSNKDDDDNNRYVWEVKEEYKE